MAAERRQRKTILLVDHEAIIAPAEKGTLERYRYAVIIAVSGEAAVQTVRQNPEIDLVLMDITGRVKVEDALRAGTSRFTVLAESCPILIWETNENKQCTLFNNRRLTYTGRSTEYRLRKPDGTYGRIYDQGSPKIDPTGAFAGYIGACTDITELRREIQEQRVGKLSVTNPEV